MPTYTADIDGGQGGDASFTADSAAEALVLAIEWANEGDWPEEGCTVDVRVQNNEDETDSASEEIEIPSEMEKKTADAETVGSNSGEWATEEVLRVGDDYFYRRCNGGTRGAYDHRSNADVFECRAIDRTEARRILLGFGESPKDVAIKTAA